MSSASPLWSLNKGCYQNTSQVSVKDTLRYAVVKGNSGYAYTGVWSSLKLSGGGESSTVSVSPASKRQTPQYDCMCTHTHTNKEHTHYIWWDSLVGLALLWAECKALICLYTLYSANEPDLAAHYCCNYKHACILLFNQRKCQTQWDNWQIYCNKLSQCD